MREIQMSASVRSARQWLILIAALMLALAIVPGRPWAQQAEPVADGPQKAKIEQFLKLLSDPEIQAYLQMQMQAAPAGPTLAEREMEVAKSASALFSQRLMQIRSHIREMAAAIPRAPREIAEAAWKVREARNGNWGALALFAGFILAGFAAEWFFRWLLSSVKHRSESTVADTPRRKIVRLLVRFLIGAGSTGVFALASAGFFLAFSWPRLLHDVVVNLLLAAVTTKIAFMLLDVFLAPQNGAVRAVPLDDATARHFASRIGIFIGWLAFGYGLVDAFRGLGIDEQVGMLIAYVLGIGLVAIALEMVWRRPRQALAGENADVPLPRNLTLNWAWTLAIVAIWGFWVLGITRLFWIALALIIVPVLARNMRRTVYGLFSPGPGTQPSPESAPSVMAALVERVMRAAIILGAIWLLARGWNVSLTSLAAETDTLNRLGRSLLIVLLILLAIDLAWQLLKTIIDAAIEASGKPGVPGSSMEIRRMKIRTLLPPIRNVTLFFLIMLALFMTLSTLGVEIGPLIASAGVVGVAIGFGAQTLFKDIISGMFYLLDDAFRIGEYIVAGNYKGTVESFSLRSVRLRHHRGPVYTVPFGSLGAVQNMSRDFVIDKFVLNVTYDSDIEKARKLLKEIGKELAQDPELKPLILEPLKMQAVGDFGDAGIQLKVKMMCLPGGQYMVRKKAYPLIKKKFDENGIEFAYPTVKIAGDVESDEDVKIAVAQQAMARKAVAQQKPDGQ